MTETINFRNFMKNDYRKIKKVDYKVLSVAPLAFINSSSFFSMSSMMTNAYLLIGGVGLVAILVCVLENYLAGRGNTEAAESIMSFFKFVMPLVFIAIAVYVVMTNPILNWL